MASEYKEDVEQHNKKLEAEIDTLNENLEKTEEELDYIKSSNTAIEESRLKPSISPEAVEDLKSLHNVNATDEIVELCEWEMIFNIGKNEIFRDSLKKRYPHQFSGGVSIEKSWEDFDNKSGEEE